MVGIVLYQPDIPQNVGAILRLCACLDARLHIIGPLGFAWDEKKLKRAGMDYIGMAEFERHDGWADFVQWKRQEMPSGRLVLFSTRGGKDYRDFHFVREDLLLFGQESGGVPDTVRRVADVTLMIPMRPGARSLNVGMSAAIALAQAKAQLEIK